MSNKIKKLIDFATYSSIREATHKCEHNIDLIWNYTCIVVDKVIDNATIATLHDAINEELEDVK
jgi:hypothetical protein